MGDFLVEKFQWRNFRLRTFQQRILLLLFVVVFVFFLVIRLQERVLCGFIVHNEFLEALLRVFLPQVRIFLEFTHVILSVIVE